MASKNLATKKTVATSTSQTQSKPKFDFAFGKENYILLIAGVLVLALGYILLIGGGSKDPNVFNYDIFDTRRMVIAPLLMLAGFVIEIFAIMKKPKSE